jgi:lysophospholipase L1-like esterase
LAHYDFGASCAATVDQYLSCIEDWNANLDCAAIGFMGWGTPDVRPGCLALLNACPQFIPEYGDPAYFVPHCDKATSPVRVDTDDDIRGIDVCRPVPTRMVVLGDSIASCLFSFDPDGSTICAPDLIADYLRAHYAPTLEYESHAYPGAVTADGLTQAEAVTPGPGHVLVWVYLGGNDIAPCVLPDMQQAMTCVDNVIASLTSEWKPIVDYFSDPARFPDGVTFMLNTQYGLKDECQNPGAAFLGTTPELDQKLQEYNQRLFIDPALARLDTVAVDQYPDWLGHGAFADNARCPHCYRDDNTRWLFFDGVHPNATGQRHIASKWEIAIDRIYGACKP